MIEEYKIVIFPEKKASIEIKKRICDYSRVLKILKPTMNDPFITIKSEFKFVSDNISELSLFLSDFFKKQSAFSLKIRKLGIYTQREIHYEIERSLDLKKLHKKLITELNKHFAVKIFAIEGDNYSFNIPMLYGDFGPNGFNKALMLVTDYKPQIDFDVKNVSLIVKKGNFWKLIGSYNFEN